MFLRWWGELCFKGLLSFSLFSFLTHIFVQATTFSATHCREKLCFVKQLNCPNTAHEWFQFLVFTEYQQHPSISYFCFQISEQNQVSAFILFSLTVVCSFGGELNFASKVWLDPFHNFWFRHLCQSNASYSATLCR